MTWDENEARGPHTDEGLAPSDPLDQTGFGRYRLVASLAQGGMANVYLGVALGPAGFNKLMVIKALREDVVAHSEEFAAMFLDEARLSARLSHPNIVQTYEIGASGRHFFIAMEYLEGQPLRVAQRRLGRVGLPLEEELRILAETARGLHYAHELRGLGGEFLGVVHRDVSPQNVFLTYDGQVKLLDFGIAKARDAEHLTKVGVIKGKLDYIAPEQIRGEKLDRRADVFSLGAMLWEALTGQRFGGGSKIPEVTKMHRRLVGAEPPARELNPELPDTLGAIVERARALDPAERFPTAAAFAEALEQFLKTMGMHPSARSLGDRLAAPFSAERARISWLIEQQVRQAVESNQRLSALPNLGRTDRESSASVATGAFGGAPSASGRSLDGRPLDGRPGQNTGTFPAPAAPSLIPAAPYPRLSGAKVAAVIAVLGLASGTALWLRKEGSQGELREASVSGERGPARAAAKPPASPPAASLPVVSPPAVSPPAASPSAASQPAELPRPAAQASVELHIEVLPADAQAMLDGAVLPKLPFAAELTRDGLLHHLDVSAPGHQSKRVLVPFDRDRDVTVVLDPVAPLPLRASRSRRRAESDVEAPSALEGDTSRVEELQPGAKLPTIGRVKAQIDTENPYAD